MACRHGEVLWRQQALWRRRHYKRSSPPFGVKIYITYNTLLRLFLLSLLDECYYFSCFQHFYIPIVCYILLATFEDHYEQWEVEPLPNVFLSDAHAFTMIRDKVKNCGDEWNADFTKKGIVRPERVPRDPSLYVLKEMSFSIHCTMGGT